MYRSNNQEARGLVFLVIWTALMLYIGGDVTPNLESLDEPESMVGIGHPLWND